MIQAHQTLLKPLANKYIWWKTPEEALTMPKRVMAHLWRELRHAPNLGFTLYGGTAIALRLGHRDSVDFDFFSDKPLDREASRARSARGAAALKVLE